MRLGWGRVWLPSSLRTSGTIDLLTLPSLLWAGPLELVEKQGPKVPWSLAAFPEPPFS